VSGLDISGFVAPGFEAVRAAFAMDPRGGSALAVIHRGEVVVDLREGWRDPARTTPWDAETLVNVYSVGKPVIALAVLMLVERGLIRLGRPDDAVLAVVSNRHDDPAGAQPHVRAGDLRGASTG
jgi:CubicO group peptidase (beta-lactamase class C family)